MAIQNGQTYYPFNPTEDVVSDRQDISAGLWSGGSGNLIRIYSSSTQLANTGDYYVDAYQADPLVAGTSTPEIQFSIAYGHKAGSGSLKLNDQYPTRAIYAQYKNVLLEPTDDYFTIGTSNAPSAFFINFSLDRIKQTIDPGNWQLSLYDTTAMVTRSFIDDSGQTVAAELGKSGRIFNVVPGTIAGGATSTTAVGLIYPDAGIIVLNPAATALSGSISSSVGGSSNTDSKSPMMLFGAINGAMTGSTAMGFIARNVENIASTHYFVRAKSAAFNFSNNPTFITGSLGDLLNQDMIKNPTVYITTIGLYNNNNELLAVAKLSQPLKKTFTNEALVRVKLDF